MKNQKGSALIQVVIAAAMLTVISLAVTNMITEQQKSVSFLEDRLSNIDFKGELIGKLNDRNACSQTIAGLRVRNLQAINSLRESDGSVAYSTNGQNASFDRLNITRLELVNVSLRNAADESGDMRLRVFTNRQRQGGGPADLAPFELSIRAETDTNSRLVSCKAYGDGSGQTAGGGLDTSELDEYYKCGRPPFGGSHRSPALSNSYNTGEVVPNRMFNSLRCSVVCVAGQWVRMDHTCYETNIR